MTSHSNNRQYSFCVTDNLNHVYHDVGSIYLPESDDKRDETEHYEDNKSIYETRPESATIRDSGIYFAPEGSQINMSDQSPPQYFSSLPKSQPFNTGFEKVDTYYNNSQNLIGNISELRYGENTDEPNAGPNLSDKLIIPIRLSMPYPLLSLSCDQVSMREQYKIYVKGVAATNGYLHDRIQKISLDLILHLKNELEVFFIFLIPGSNQFFSALLNQLKDDLLYLQNCNLVIHEKYMKVMKNNRDPNMTNSSIDSHNEKKVSLEIHADDLSDMVKHNCILVCDEVNSQNFDKMCTIVDWLQTSFSPSSVQLLSLLTQDDCWKHMNLVLKAPYQAGFAYPYQERLRIVGFGIGHDLGKDDLMNSQHLFYLPQ